MNCGKCKWEGCERICRMCSVERAVATLTHPSPRPSKFNAVICEADGIKFRSKKERRRYLELEALKHAGEVSHFLMQVPFRLPGNVKYLLDFLVFWKDGNVTYEDSKGAKTPMYIMKKKQVEALYPVRIVEP